MAAFPEQTRWILARAVGQGGEAVGGKLPAAGYPRPVLEDFEMRREPAPTEADLSDGEVLIEHHVLSVDPYVPAYMMKEPNVGKAIVAALAAKLATSERRSPRVAFKHTANAHARSRAARTLSEGAPCTYEAGGAVR